jgi:phosphatidylglycerophosphate synthase
MTNPMELAPRRALATRSAGWAIAISRRLGGIGVRPNDVSICGLVFALAGSTAFCTGRDATPDHRAALLLTAAASIQLRLLCNLLDGMLAVEGGFKTRTGMIWNDFPDRVSDAVLLAGAGYAAANDAYGALLGWACALCAVLTAYVRVLGGSIGVAQHFIGPMAKQHRMFTLTVAAAIAAVEQLVAAPPRAITIGLIVILAGSIVTVIRRTRRIAHEMNAP